MSSDIKIIFEQIPKSDASIKKTINSYKYRDQFFRPRSKPRSSGILKSATKHRTFRSNEKRKDAYGTPIQKGGKVHKVSFIDEIKKGGIGGMSEIEGTNRSVPEINSKYNSKDSDYKINHNIHSYNYNKDIIEKKVEIKCKACSIF